MIDTEIADTTVAQDGSTDGDAVLGHKRKRDIEDEAGRGMDIDAVESIGGLLSRMSLVDPEIEQWAKHVNEQYDSKVTPCTGVTDGDTGVGMLGKVEVMEMYSPPRVTVEAKDWGLKAGEAMYLVTGYDFNKIEDRTRAWEAIVGDKPSLVIGSPECKMLSGLQHLTKWTEDRQKKLEMQRNIWSLSAKCTNTR